MGKRIGGAARAQRLELLSLSQLIHHEVRVAIETAVHEELRTALGATPTSATKLDVATANGTKIRTLAGPVCVETPAADTTTYQCATAVR